jgi:hypothetical protein
MAESVEKWLQKITAYEQEFKRWESRVSKLLKRYKDEGRRESDTAKFNILWSNVQTAVPAVFSRLPKPDVSRRFRDNDPVGRVASLILERALEFEIEHYPDYRAAMKNSVMDRFLGGRGVSWVRYEPHFKAAEPNTPEDGLQVTEDAEQEGEADEEIDYECTPVDYVNWKDFGHTVARTWEEVTAVWRIVYMGREALIERFGEEIGKKIPLDTKPDKDRDKPQTDEQYEACIYEIWDKDSNTAIWISKAMKQILDERDDPLKLESFFPCPRPLFATLTSDSLVPTPDFTLYQDQARELDILCDRIDGLIKALQLKGVYDASVPELARLFTEGANGTLLPVKNWAAFSEKQGLKGAIDLADIEPIARALLIAYQAMEQVKGQVYEITGLSDIIRGQTEASETATAQQLKGQYASLRLKSMQSEVSQFAAELLQIKAQIMCTLYQDDTLIQISAAGQLSDQDKALIPQALQLLKNEPLRNFRIEVSSDSMVQMDEQQEKQDRTELLTAIGQYLREALQAPPDMAPLLADLLKFAVTGFKVGKNIEGAIDQFAEQAKEKAKQPPGPTPEQQKAQADMQAAQQQAQIDAQVEDRRMQAEAQLEERRIAMEAQAAERERQAELQAEYVRNQMETQREQFAHQAELQLQAMKDESAKQAELIKQQFAMLIARMNNETTLETAQISAATTLEAAQQSAAEKASDE